MGKPRDDEGYKKNCVNGHWMNSLRIGVIQGTEVNEGPSLIIVFRGGRVKMCTDDDEEKLDTITANDTRCNVEMTCIRDSILDLLS